MCVGWSQMFYVVGDKHYSDGIKAGSDVVPTALSLTFFGVALFGFQTYGACGGSCEARGFRENEDGGHCRHWGSEEGLG